jgi:hypothetical protein
MQSELPTIWPGSSTPAVIKRHNPISRSPEQYLPFHDDIDDCDKLASGRYIQREIEDIADKIANRQTETIKLLGARICMGI